MENHNRMPNTGESIGNWDDIDNRQEDITDISTEHEDDMTDEYGIPIDPSERSDDQEIRGDASDDEDTDRLGIFDDERWSDEDETMRTSIDDRDRTPV